VLTDIVLGNVGAVIGGWVFGRLGSFPSARSRAQSWWPSPVRSLTGEPELRQSESEHHQRRAIRHAHEFKKHK
jgi:hypothetical protein